MMNVLVTYLLTLCKLLICHFLMGTDYTKKFVLTFALSDGLE